MKKILNIVILILLLNVSCRQDEFYINRNLNNNIITNKQYEKKSPWKEKEKFIIAARKTIIDNIDVDLVYEEYGEIYWDYAITSEKSKNIIIPVIKNGKVVDIIDAVHRGKKLYIFRNNKEEYKSFFNTLIFDKENKLYFSENKDTDMLSELEIKSKNIDTKLKTNSFTYRCYTKTLIIGCLSEASCEDISYRIMFCKLEYDSNFSYVLDYDYYEFDNSPYFFRDRISESGGGGKSFPFEYNDDDNYERDSNFDPKECEKVDDKNYESKYADKINELNNNKHFNKKHETGYYEDINGNFNELANAESTANSDGLNIPISQNTRGYIHTHQNDYDDGYDEDGNTKTRKPIRMFSPADVNAIMEIAKLREDGDYDDIYGTMVASNGIYTIKFTGTKENIKTGFDTEEWRGEYIKFMQDPKGSIETKFLRFIKEKMNIEGISLFKTNWRTKMVDEIKLNHKKIAKKHGC